jgi:hypothetical protein
VGGQPLLARLAATAALSSWTSGRKKNGYGSRSKALRDVIRGWHSREALRQDQSAHGIAHIGYVHHNDDRIMRTCSLPANLGGALFTIKNIAARAIFYWATGSFALECSVLPALL